MPKNHAPLLFKLLSNDLRWGLLKALSTSDMRVQELADLLGQPQNLISYHLQKMRDYGLIRDHPSIADGREVYYGIHLNQVHELFKCTQESLHPGLLLESPDEYSFPALRVLFLCTQNSARSQMAEGFLRTKGKGIIQAFSAGTDPAPAVNPNAIQVMSEFNIDIRDQRSKNLAQFLDQPFDTIITVCDRAREACPVFAGNPTRIHWSIPDPTEISGTPDERYHAFRSIALELDERINYFLSSNQK